MTIIANVYLHRKQNKRKRVPVMTTVAKNGVAMRLAEKKVEFVLNYR